MTCFDRWVRQEMRAGDPEMHHRFYKSDRHPSAVCAAGIECRVMNIVEYIEGPWGGKLEHGRASRPRALLGSRIS